ncbi:hypothetical protein BS47DRAFT_1360261 [Hydnum rufescens UP504]|uniref:Uncharacterized protein n=1 Tax=Hydnum rufescens UP504 TaxID=1448309 RepID=A0A9P6B2Q3_9AGAM|nr:hypothetical protein BS47DRAFT_1360261 [Hydnum rufescens UP504]
MHILESKLPQVLLDNAQADRFNSALQNDLSASIHAPTPWSTSMKQSSNPLPIKPQPKKKVMLPPSNPSQQNHNHPLLIKFFPKIEPEKHEVGHTIVSKINDALACTNACQVDHIDVIQYSLNGNTVIIMGEHTTADDLKDYYALISSLLSPNEFTAHPDHVYHRVTEKLTDKWVGFKAWKCVSSHHGLDMSQPLYSNQAHQSHLASHQKKMHLCLETRECCTYLACHAEPPITLNTHKYTTATYAALLTTAPMHAKQDQCVMSAPVQSIQLTAILQNHPKSVSIVEGCMKLGPKCMMHTPNG